MLHKCTLWRVFGIFAQSPSKQFLIREISRNLKLAHTSVNIHLTTLIKEKLIRKNKEGLYPTYQANRNEQFFFYKRIHNLEKLKKTKIIKFLEDEFTPDTVILFGSYEKGEDTENSDIDIFIQGKTHKISEKKFERQLKKKIQLHVEQDINKLPKELYHNIITGKLLSGFIRWPSKQHQIEKKQKV